jgi:hypothetical protein
MFETIVEKFLEDNPSLSRDERNIQKLVDFLLSKKISLTEESVPVLLTAFLREHSSELFWNAQVDKPVMQPPLSKRYNPAEELARAAEERKQQRENVQKNAELTQKRADFEKAMRDIRAWKEFRGAHVNWSQTFSAQKEKYEALGKAHPMWASECEAASARVGK